MRKERTTAASRLTSAEKRETGKKKKKKKTRLKGNKSSVSTSWASAASRQKAHTGELSRQEGVEDEHHRLGTRVEVKHLRDGRSRTSERGQDRREQITVMLLIICNKPLIYYLVYILIHITLLLLSEPNNKYLLNL